MKSIKQLREKFEAYYADLKASAKADGYRVNKADEWERFLEKAREEGEVAA